MTKAVWNNPVERCWSALEHTWNGISLSCVSLVLSCAARMTCKGRPPEIAQLPGEYPSGVKLSPKEMASLGGPPGALTDASQHVLTINLRGNERR
ncbi:MAG: ISAzo13-like element transposase-related protein [bacterium]